MTLSVLEAYAALGLTRDATPELIRKTYRKLALRFHPDKNPDPEATTKFQQLSAAYKRLDEHAKRDGDSEPDEDLFSNWAATAGDDFGASFGFAGDLDDDFDMPSMTEMLFMFDMLFGSQSAKRGTSAFRSRGGGGRSNTQSKSAGSASVRRRGQCKSASRSVSAPGPPSYIDQELMDMFAHGLSGGAASASGHRSFIGMESGLFGLEDDLFAMGFLDESDVSSNEEDSNWSSSHQTADVENKHETTNEAASPAASMEPSSSSETCKTALPVKVGAAVYVYGRHAGVVKFAGPVHYAKGEFVGVALRAPVGKNDGAIKGVRYFECEPSHGLMVRPGDLAPAA